MRSKFSLYLRLSTVMTAILDEEPTESELKELMKTLDTDHSGTVEWEEFVEAMTNWYVLNAVIF